MKTMPSTLSRGFQTSDMTGNYIGLMSGIINKTVAELAAINADRTLTKAQRSPALSKLHSTSEQAFKRQLAKAYEELGARDTKFERDVDMQLRGKLSTVELSQLAQQLKGMTTTDRVATIEFSADYARAAVLAPPALSGGAITVETYLKHHEPNLLEVKEQISRDLSALNSIEKHFTTGLIHISMETDHEAMAAKYEPKLDSIDPEPRANESAAAYNARQADTNESPNPNVLPRFDEKVGGYHAREGDVPSAY